MASVNPSALDYAQNLVAVQTGVPMQFNAASGLWEASYTLPTEFDQGFYKGVPTYTLAGGWTVSYSRRVCRSSSGFAVIIFHSFTLYHA